MAEAGVGTPSNTTGRFFCHKCNEELSHVLEDFTCPKCKAGFVEKLSDVPPPSQSQSSSGSGSSHGMNFHDAGLAFPFLEILQGMTRDMEVNVSPPSGQNARSTPGSGSAGRTPDMNFSFVMDVRPRGNNQSGGQPNTGQNPPPPLFSFLNAGQQNSQGQNPQNPMENVLFSFLNDLITGLSGGGAVTVGGGIPMMANLGDYVWGRDGLDAIVTQLMNQMEGTGPPPMPSEKLDKLPTVKISQEQVDRKLQCSVCWDDFQLHEEVKQLECDANHVFHQDCILPWLKLHGTCPICRKDLTNSEDASGAPSARFEPPTSGTPRGQGGSGSSSGRGNQDLDRMDDEFD